MTISPATTTTTETQPAYLQSLAGAMAGATGGHGLTPAAFERHLADLDAPVAALAGDYRSGHLPLLSIVDDTADIAAARAALDRLSIGARTIVFFGTGGSSLGGQTLAQLSGWNIAGAAEAAQKSRPRTRFYDNLDGQTLERALRSLDLATTRFVVTSKSGGTVETLVQAIAALSAVRAAGLERDIPRLFLGLTEAARPGVANGLRQLFESLRVPVLDHHAGIGGRFSVLSNVGLLPALARGLDAARIRAGAASVVAGLGRGTARGYAPAEGAALAVGLARERSIGTHVFMPYADRLGRFAHWFVQLWAESLGKGGHGTSPIACLGPLDQHSQLQLFMDGPRDHLITLLRTPTAGTGPRIDARFAETSGIGFMAGKAIGDLVAAQTLAVPEALQRAGRPVRTIDIPRLDEFSAGALLMHFMIETILVARLLGIDPFDQPAVEAAKRIARERLDQG